MVNFLTRFRVIGNILFFIIVGIGSGFLMIIYFNDLLDELSEVRGSDVIGVWGTTYALITAFVLITVWTHFNDTDKAISNETKALIALWNNTDYLEDDVVSAEMNKALLEYSNMVVNDEISEHRRMNTVEFPKTEFIQIMKVIDKVEFDDPRDPIVFEALISAYKDLSDARNNRIIFLSTRIPVMLKVFYLFASFIFWFGYLIEGFESDVLYIIVLVLVTIVTVLAYAIIFDLDKALEGLLQVSTNSYEKTSDYIKSTKHEIFVDGH